MDVFAVPAVEAPPVVGAVAGRAGLSDSDCCEDVDGAVETSNGSEITASPNWSPVRRGVRPQALRGLEKVAWARFQGAAFGVGDALDVNDTLKSSGEDFIFRFEELFQHEFTLQWISGGVKKSLYVLKTVSKYLIWPCARVVVG